MIRDVVRLATEQFDVVVIGGGIYGLALTWELTSRGVKTALVERGDFSAGTSFNSLRTIHGGIRPLQHGALAEMREFVRERRAFARIAPHLVRVLPFIVPTSRHPLRNAVAMGAFLRLYDLLAADRNRNIDPSRALPASRLVSREECLRHSPLIDPRGVTGGAIWHDYQMPSPERFAIALLESATRAGAAAANYSPVQALVRRDGKITGAIVRDEVTREVFEIRTGVVVNAAGPWAWSLLEAFDAVPASRRRPGLSLAMNLVLHFQPPSHALGGFSGGRFLFLVPWRDRAVVGTSHHVFDGEPDSLRVERRHVDALLGEAARAFPHAALNYENVTLVHRGLLPASGIRTSSLLRRTIVHDHRADGVQGLVTILGVRYTTARATARRAADMVLALLGRAAAPSETERRPLAGGEIADVDSYIRQQTEVTGFERRVVERLVANYGTGYQPIAAMMRETPVLAVPLGAACPVTPAEVLHAVRAEMALHLDDVLLRRTGAGPGGDPGPEVVSAAACIMATELGWSGERRAAEQEAVHSAYRL